MIAIILGLVLDHFLGEPKRFHPLVGFGTLANKVEAIFRDIVGNQLYIAGLLAWLVAVLPCVLVISWLQQFLPVPTWMFDAVVVYLAIGRKSLAQHAMAIYEPLAAGRLDEARKRVGYIVSRETDKLNEPGIAKATVESVLENGSDSTFAVLFWYAVGGAPFVVLYRLANTLDAMWGYKNDRFYEFGFVTAKLDDLLNYIPARLTVLGYAAMGRGADAIRCAWEQGPLCESPNAGPVMAAGAGAMGVTLGGEYRHSGKVIHKPILGVGREAAVDDIKAAVGLVDRAVLAWLVVIAIATWA